MKIFKNRFFNDSIPNRSLDRYSAIHYREDNFLSSFILLLALVSRLFSTWHATPKANEKQSAQRWNEIWTESNDRLRF